MMTLEQIVVDDEIACLCKRLKDGVDMSEAKNYFEDIKEVKPGGHFLSQSSTIQACRSNEFFMPQLCDRNTYEHWVGWVGRIYMTRPGKRLKKFWQARRKIHCRMRYSVSWRISCAERMKS